MRRGAGWHRPSRALIVLAAVGAALLLVAATRWFEPHDQAAYWRAAKRLLSHQPVYLATAAPDAPYAYWYPPVLAQILAPLTAFISEQTFVLAWAGLQVACLLVLASGEPLLALALVSFLPVAVELFEGNVHLLIAVLVLLALRRSPYFWIPATAVKLSPVLGLLYLAIAGRIREAVRVGLIGCVVLGVSYILAPDVWQAFLGVVGARALDSRGSLLPISYPVRLAFGAGCAALGGRVGGNRGEFLLLVGITIANPTLWYHALSILIAIVPLVRSSGPRPVPGLHRLDETTQSRADPEPR